MYIVGQKTLVNDLERIFTIFKSSNCEIRPHFILTGPSGSGKSMSVRHVAEKLKLNYLEINGAQLTKEGTSGNSLSKALSPMINLSNSATVIFVDEFDKMFISGNTNDSHAHEATTGVQNEFLRVLESDVTSVFGDYGKYVTIPIKNTLFVFAGAFNGEEDISIDRLREIGLKTEFLGRVGLVFNAKKLSFDDLVEILDNSTLLDSYSELFKDIEKDVVKYRIMAYLKENYEHNTLGGRVVNTLIHKYFIKGGKLNESDVKKTMFQQKLDL